MLNDEACQVRIAAVDALDGYSIEVGLKRHPWCGGTRFSATHSTSWRGAS
jgi:hypothetical protein